MQLEFEGHFFEIIHTEESTIKMLYTQGQHPILYVHPHMDIQQIQTYIRLHHSKDISAQQREAQTKQKSFLTEYRISIFDLPYGLKVYPFESKEQLYIKGNCIYLHTETAFRWSERLKEKIIRYFLKQKLNDLIAIWEEKLHILTAEIQLKRLRKNWFLWQEHTLICHLKLSLIPEELLNFMVGRLLIQQLNISTVERQKRLAYYFPQYLQFEEKLNYFEDEAYSY